MKDPPPLRERWRYDALCRDRWKQPSAATEGICRGRELAMGIGFVWILPITYLTNPLIFPFSSHSTPRFRRRLPVDFQWRQSRHGHARLMGHAHSPARIQMANVYSRHGQLVQRSQNPILMASISPPKLLHYCLPPSAGPFSATAATPSSSHSVPFGSP